MDLLWEKLWHRPIQRKTEVETILHRRSGPVEWQNDGSSTQGDRDMETDRQERSSESRNEDSGKHCDFRR